MTLHYEPNRKHKEPWQPGRKGALCPHWAGLDPAQLLASSVLDGKKRYAVFNGMAFAAQRHRELNGKEYWHGYPEAWENIPADIRRAWIRAGVITRRQVKQYWKSTDSGDDE